MSSEKQIEANRRNGQLGGVKTNDGKERVKFNALKHGLSSNHLILNMKSIKENQELYYEIYWALNASLKPRNFFEESLVDQMARSQFKFSRSEMLEKNSFGEDFSMQTFDKNEFVANENKLQLAMRYKTSLESQYFKAYQALIQARAPQQLGLFGFEDYNENR